MTFLAPPSELDTLVRHTDGLLYDAKAGGRNRSTGICRLAPRLRMQHRSAQ